MGSIVLFADGFDDRAAVYLHGDDGDVPERLGEFFRHEQDTARVDRRYGLRFDDPEYLAARFVVHQSGPTGTGVGVTRTSERSDTNYRVVCTSDGPPRVESLGE